MTGTGATGDEAYALEKGAFDAFGHPVCDIDFPDFTTADIQVSVQYLVRGIRAMARRAGARSRSPGSARAACSRAGR